MISDMGLDQKTWFISLHFQLCEQEKYPQLKWKKERLSKFNLFVSSTQTEDMQKEVVLNVFTLLRNRDFRNPMCFQK